MDENQNKDKGVGKKVRQRNQQPQRMKGSGRGTAADSRQKSKSASQESQLPTRSPQSARTLKGASPASSVQSTSQTLAQGKQILVRAVDESVGLTEYTLVNVPATFDSFVSACMKALRITAYGCRLVDSITNEAVSKLNDVKDGMLLIAEADGDAEVASSQLNQSVVSTSNQLTPKKTPKKPDSVDESSSAKGTSRSPYTPSKQKWVYIHMMGKVVKGAGRRIRVPHSFQQLLDDCTAKLQLNFAAKRIFTMSGTPINSLEGIENDMEIIVSTGQSFRITRESPGRTAPSTLTRQPSQTRDNHDYPDKALIEAHYPTDAGEQISHRGSNQSKGSTKTHRSVHHRASSLGDSKLNASTIHQQLLKKKSAIFGIVYYSVDTMHTTEGVRIQIPESIDELVVSCSTALGLQEPVKQIYDINDQPILGASDLIDGSLLFLSIKKRVKSEHRATHRHVDLGNIHSQTIQSGTRGNDSAKESRSFQRSANSSQIPKPSVFSKAQPQRTLDFHSPADALLSSQLAESLKSLAISTNEPESPHFQKSRGISNEHKDGINPTLKQELWDVIIKFKGVLRVKQEAIVEIKNLFASLYSQWGAVVEKFKIRGHSYLDAFTPGFCNFPSDIWLVIESIFELKTKIQVERQTSTRMNDTEICKLENEFVEYISLISGIGLLKDSPSAEDIVSNLIGEKNDLPKPVLEHYTTKIKQVKDEVQLDFEGPLLQKILLAKVYTGYHTYKLNEDVLESEELERIFKQSRYQDIIPRLSDIKSCIQRIRSDTEILVKYQVLIEVSHKEYLVSLSMQRVLRKVNEYYERITKAFDEALQQNATNQQVSQTTAELSSQPATPRTKGDDSSRNTPNVVTQHGYVISSYPLTESNYPGSNPRAMAWTSTSSAPMRIQGYPSVAQGHHSGATSIPGTYFSVAHSMQTAGPISSPRSGFYMPGTGNPATPPSVGVSSSGQTSLVRSINYVSMTPTSSNPISSPAAQSTSNTSSGTGASQSGTTTAAPTTSPSSSNPQQNGTNQTPTTGASPTPKPPLAPLHTSSMNLMSPGNTSVQVNGYVSANGSFTLASSPHHSVSSNPGPGGMVASVIGPSTHHYPALNSPVHQGYSYHTQTTSNAASKGHSSATSHGYASVVTSQYMEETSGSATSVLEPNLVSPRNVIISQTSSSSSNPQYSAAPGVQGYPAATFYHGNYHM